MYDEGAYAGWDEDAIMQSNEELLESLRDDELEEEMQEIAMQDAALHRMTQPVPAESVVLMDVRPSQLGCLRRCCLDCLGATSATLWHSTRSQGGWFQEGENHRPLFVVMCCWYAHCLAGAMHSYTAFSEAKRRGSEQR